eukprot:m.198026 g.198026  ORF g.198026 m.198026 type:complete len:50 (+) comp17035_c0_seq1:1983-2132(+)
MLHDWLLNVKLKMMRMTCSDNDNEASSCHYSVSGVAKYSLSQHSFAIYT